MSEHVNEYEFKKAPKEVEYFDDEPLNLGDEFIFYHNKNKFRKELNRLQNLFKTYTKNSLIASGIRDTYLKEEYTENYLLLVFTKGEQVANINSFIEEHLAKKIESKCYYLVATSSYMLLLTKDMDGIISGIDQMEEIFKQTFDDYFTQKKFDDYIKIRQFKMYGC